MRAAPYVVVAAGAAYLAYVADHIEYTARAGTLGPGFWPTLILAATFAICVYEILKIFVVGRGTQVDGVLGRVIEQSAAEHEVPVEESGRRRPFLLLGGITLTSAYVALVQHLGFFAATVPYIAAFVVLGGYRRWHVVAAVSVLGTLVLIFFFMKVVYVSLPLGQGAFQQVTLLLMQLLHIR